MVDEVLAVVVGKVLSPDDSVAECQLVAAPKDGKLTDPSPSIPGRQLQVRKPVSSSSPERGRPL